MKKRTILIVVFLILLLTGCKDVSKDEVNETSDSNMEQLFKVDVQKINLVNIQQLQMKTN